MNPRKTIAAVVLGLATTLLAAQVPAGAADDLQAKIEKRKALKQKLIAAKKAAEADKAKAAQNDPKYANARPAPADVKPPAAPARPMATAALARFIDQGIDQRLATASIKPSPDASDAEFLRRAYLDITGVIPSPEKAVAFLDDKSPGKRERLIDELLQSPNYGRRMADVWANLMYLQDSDNRFIAKAPLHGWLQEKFNANLHWDAMAFELITATGEADTNGATVYAASNRGVDRLTDSVGKLFLGLQIQCAQCHNHPFTQWKQAEYWGLAQFFYKVNVSNPRAAKGGGTLSVSEDGRINRKINPVPESAKDVAPKLLGADTLKLDPSRAYRPVLASWICSPDNPFFAKAFVNRMWAQLMGRGFVNPVDDLANADNEPTHPDLLDALAREFATSGFDVKHLVRGITNSKAYQRTSKPVGDNRDDKTLYSHQAIKVLAGEQLFDSLISIIGPVAGKDNPVPKNGQRGGAQGPRDQFALFFQGGENAPPTAYEAGIPQALKLMNSTLMAPGRLTGVANRITEGGRAAVPEKAVEKLYLATLSRRPTADEAKKLTEFVARHQEPRNAYGDILWALLNSSEFALNR